MDKIWTEREHGKYTRLLQNHGYHVKYDWVSDQEFSCVEVYDKRFNNFVGEYPTPRKAYQNLICKT